MSSDKDPYALHVVVLAYGATREELASSLEAKAAEIRAGIKDQLSRGSDGVLLVRGVDQGSTDRAGEEAGACRLWGVYPDGEGVSVEDVTALFRDEEDARTYANEHHSDAAVMRTDLVLSAWNSFAPDPYFPVST